MLTYLVLMNLKIAKRTLYLLTFLLFSQVYTSAQTQRFKAGFNVGLTAAQINGDDSADYSNYQSKLY